MRKMDSCFRVNKILAAVFLLALTGMAPLFAQNIVRLTPPVLSTSDPSLSGIIAEVQAEINRVFREQQDLINNELNGISADPQRMIGAFASSSVFASTGASLRGYQGYDTFALTLGAVAGAQFPVSISSMFFGGEFVLDKIYNDFYNNSDIQLGINPQVINVQIGVNTSRFLLNGLYIGLKGGYMSLPLDIGEFSTSFKTWSAGGFLNYQLLSPQRVGGGIFVWRGVNVGAGFIYQNTNLNVEIPLDVEGTDEFIPIPIPIPIPGANVGGRIGSLKVGMDFSVNTYTVPLEVSTAVRLLGFLNLSLGLGADLGFGNASLGAGGSADVVLEGLPASVSYTKGDISIWMGGSNTPDLFNPKVMTSLGITLGPVIVLDVPVTWYLLNNGYNIGLTLGFAL